MFKEHIVAAEGVLFVQSPLSVMQCDGLQGLGWNNPQKNMDMGCKWWWW